MSVKRTVDFATYLASESMGADITGDATNIMHTDRVAYQFLGPALQRVLSMFREAMTNSCGLIFHLLLL